MYNSECVLCKTELSVESDVLQFLLENDYPGIFLLEDILESGSSEQPLVRRYSQLANAFFELKGRWAATNIGYCWVSTSNCHQS